MKTQNIILTVALLAVVAATGCAAGPATTTLSAMKNVGPITLKETRMVITNGVTNITVIERIQSPESGQLTLRQEELRQRGARQSNPQPYYWQNQNPYGYNNGGYGGGSSTGAAVGGYIISY